MRREKKDQILAVLPEKIRGILLNHGLDFEKIQEIRLREEQPLAVKKEGKEELFTHRVTKEERTAAPGKSQKNSCYVT